MWFVSTTLIDIMGFNIFFTQFSTRLSEIRNTCLKNFLHTFFSLFEKKIMTGECFFETNVSTIFWFSSHFAFRHCNVILYVFSLFSPWEQRIKRLKYLFLRIFIFGEMTCQSTIANDFGKCFCWDCFSVLLFYCLVFQASLTIQFVYHFVMAIRISEPFPRCFIFFVVLGCGNFHVRSILLNNVLIWWNMLTDLIMISQYSNTNGPMLITHSVVCICVCVRT